jgi:hypothetical protein
LDDSGAFSADNGGTVVTSADTAYAGKVLKITARAGTYTQVSADLTCDLSQGFLSFEIKTDGNFSRLAYGISVGDTSYNKRFEDTIKYADGVQAGVWRRVTVSVALSFASAGAVGSDLSNVRHFRFGLFATGGGASSALVRDLRWHPYAFPNAGKSGILMMFDDGFASQYTQAFLVMAPLGLVGSVAVDPQTQTSSCR